MTICFENETDQELDFDYENILEKVIRQAAEQEDATIYLTWIDKIYTDIQMALFVAFIYLVLFLG